MHRRILNLQRLLIGYACSTIFGVVPGHASILEHGIHIQFERCSDSISQELNGVLPRLPKALRRQGTLRIHVHCDDRIRPFGFSVQKMPEGWRLELGKSAQTQSRRATYRLDHSGESSRVVGIKFRVYLCT